MTRRLTSARLLVAAALLVWASVSLRADPAATSSLRWQVQRPDAVAIVDSTLYVATQDPIVPTGTGGALAVFSTVDAVASPVPAADNAILSLIGDGSGGWYVGGLFSTIGGVARQGLAHVRADGSVDPSFSVTFTGGSTVTALLFTGTQLVVGGGFTAVNGVARVGVAVLDAATGAVLPVNPVIDGGAYALAVSGSTLLVGGTFTMAGGQPRANLAAFTLATGALVAGFTADTDDAVTTIAVSGASLFINGAFTTVNGTPRSTVAKLALGTGAVDSAWNADPDQRVFSIAVAGTSVYAGGLFSTIGGQSRASLAALDMVTGAATTWRADTDQGVIQLATDGTRLFATGGFTVIGGEYRRYGASLTTGATASVLPWHPSLFGGAFAVAIANGRIALGGAFDGWHAREGRGLSAIDLRSGDLLPWSPRLTASGRPWVRTIVPASGQLVIGGDFTGVGGYTREYLASFDLATREVTPLALAINGPVDAAVAIGNMLYVGGEFTMVNGQARQHLFAVDLVTGQLQGWAPQANDVVWTLVTSGGRLFAGGAFTAITDGGGTKPRAGLAEITPAGAVTSFDVHAAFPGVSPQVRRMVVDGSRLFFSGAFLSVQGTARARAAAVDVATAALLPWQADTDTEATGLSVHRGSVYLAGAFATVNGQPAAGMVRVNDTTGARSSWTPAAAPTLGFDVQAVEAGVVYFGGVSGTPPLKRVWFYPDTAPGAAPGAPEGLDTRIENGTLSLAWTRATIGAPPASYVLEAGSAPGLANIGTLPLSATSFTVPGVPPGVYYLRVRAVNGAGVSAPSPEVTVVAGATGCVAGPPPPTPQPVVVNGATIALSWQPSPGAGTTSYTVQAGTAEGRADLGTVPLGASSLLTVDNVPAGVYFVRATAANACGFTSPSSDSVVRVGGAVGPPMSPVRFAATVTGGVVSLSWLTPSTGGVPTSHVLDVGTGPGLSNLGTVPLGAGTSLTAPGVPAGTYYLRLRAVNAVGPSAPSGELVLVVP